MDWIGAVLVVVALVVVGPVALFAGGAVWSAIIGWFATDDAERRYADSEHVKTRSW